MKRPGTHKAGDKRRVLILGAGKIGGAIVDLLFATGDYAITVADSNAAFLKLAAGKKAKAEKIDVSDMKALSRIAKGQQAVLSALPFFLNPGVAFNRAGCPLDGDLQVITSRSFGSCCMS